MSSQSEGTCGPKYVEEIGRRQYSRDESTTNPFEITAASGSEWNKDHLNWLGVDLEDGHKPLDLISKEWTLQESSTISRILTRLLDLTWSDIKNGKHSMHGLGGIYSTLQLVGRKDSSIHAPIFSPSSTPVSPASAGTAEGEERLPVEESPSERKPKRCRLATSTPDKQVGGPSTMGGSPSSAHKSKRPRAEPSVPPSSPPVDGEKTPIPDVRLESSPPPVNDGRTTPPDAGPASLPPPYSLPSTPSALPELPPLTVQSMSTPYLSSRSSDITYRPSSIQNPSALSDQSWSSQEDKPEAEVLRAAYSFCLLVEHAIGQVKTAVEIEVRSGFPLKVSIDGSVSQTTPDLNLAWKCNERSDQLLVECKRKLHQMRDDEILGQEVCHLLCKAQADKNRRKRDHYTIFLLSWHHLDAYISRLDVSDAYLERLAYESQNLDGRLAVKRTQPFSLKDPSERIQLATHTAEILLFLLAQFQSCHETATQLHDFKAD